MKKRLKRPNLLGKVRVIYPMREQELVVRNVWIKKGPDIEKYDLVFEENGMRLRLIGEYWQSARPKTGLQRKSDLLICSIKRKRERNSNTYYGYYIDYCDIKYFEVRKQMTCPAKQQANNKPRVRLILILKNGRRLDIEASVSMYKIVKELVRDYLVRGIENCKKEGDEEGPII